MQRAALGLLTVSLSLAFGCREPAAGGGQPNVLLLSIDTLRADRLGCYGHDQARTPELDALASRGVVFEHVSTPSPLTLPAHASLFTGMLPCAHGVRDNVEFRLPASAPTLAGVLQAEGYETAAFVSAFVLDSWHGLDRGFGVYEDALGRSNERTCDETNLAVSRWLRERPDEGPFFAFVHYWEPHRPYRPAAPLLRGTDVSSLYDAEVTHADTCAGNLLRLIDELEGSGDTLVVVVSDHGEGLSEHGEPEHGAFLYDSTLRVPWIMAGPDLPAGRRVAGEASLVDVAPTILALAGATRTLGPAGESLASAVREGAVRPRALYAETVHPRLAHGYSQLKALRQGGTKLIWAPRTELYDLASDPLETRDLAGERPREVERMQARLRTEIVDCVARGLDPELGAPSDEARERLLALGYVSEGADAVEAGTEFELDFSGDDPKDRVRELAAYQDAIFAATTGELRRAERSLRDVLERDPDNPMALRTLGVVLLQAGRAPEALVELERAHELLPGSYEVSYALALAQAQRGRIDASMDALEALLEQHPGRSRVHAKLAQLHVHRGRLDEGLAHALRVVEIDPSNVDGHVNLGDLHVRRSERGPAIEAYRRALELEPWSAPVRERLTALGAD